MYNSEVLFDELCKSNEQILKLLPSEQLISMDIDLDTEVIQQLNDLTVRLNVSLDAVVMTLLKLYINENKTLISKSV